MQGIDELAGLFARGLREPALWGLLLLQLYNWAVPWLVQRELLRRMDEERRSRSWNALSWAMAIVWLGMLSMLPFVWVTRPRRGFGPGALALFVGLLWTALVTGVVLIGSEGIGWVFGLS